MIPRLHYVSQNNLEGLSHVDMIRQACQAGVRWVSLRVKYHSYSELKPIAFEVQKICQDQGATFVINDNVLLAKEIGADGVHLGRNDMDIDMARKILGDKIIGVSCYNNLEDAITAEIMGADYIALGSFFSSPTKPEARKIAIDLLPIAKSKLKKNEIG